MSKKYKTILLSHEQPPMLGGAGVVADIIYTGLRARDFPIDINKPACEFKGIIARFIGIYYVFKALFYNSIILNDLYYKKLWLSVFRGGFANKCIIYLHGSEPEFLIDNTAYTQRFIKLCSHSKKIIAVSEYMRDKFLESIPINERKVLEDKVIVIRNGVDTEIFNFKNANKSNDKVVIVSASRLVLGKGYIELADEIKKLSLLLNKPLQWYIAGSGPDEDKIKDYVTNIGLADMTVFVGKLDQHSLAKLYKKAHFFILLSKLKESLGLVYMEASCCGCFSIGFNRYGVKEAIIDNETGFLISQQLDLSALISIDSKHISNEISKIACQSFSKSIQIDNLFLLFKDSNESSILPR